MIKNLTVNIGPGNGNNPLSKAMLTYNQWDHASHGVTRPQCVNIHAFLIILVLHFYFVPDYFTNIFHNATNCAGATRRKILKNHIWHNLGTRQIRTIIVQIYWDILYIVISFCPPSPHLFWSQSELPEDVFACTRALREYPERWWRRLTDHINTLRPGWTDQRSKVTMILWCRHNIVSLTEGWHCYNDFN